MRFEFPYASIKSKLQRPPSGKPTVSELLKTGLFCWKDLTLLVENPRPSQARFKLPNPGHGRRSNAGGLLGGCWSFELIYTLQRNMHAKSRLVKEPFALEHSLEFLHSILHSIVPDMITTYLTADTTLYVTGSGVVNPRFSKRVKPSAGIVGNYSSFKCELRMKEVNLNFKKIN